MGTRSDLTRLPHHTRASEVTSPHCCPLQFPHPLTPCLWESPVEWSFINHNFVLSHKSQSISDLACCHNFSSGKSRSFPAQRVENHGFQISPATCPYGPASICGQKSACWFWQGTQSADHLGVLHVTSAIVSQEEYSGGPQAEWWAALGGSLVSHSGSNQRGRVLLLLHKQRFWLRVEASGSLGPSLSKMAHLFSIIYCHAPAFWRYYHESQLFPCPCTTSLSTSFHVSELHITLSWLHPRQTPDMCCVPFCAH